MQPTGIINAMASKVM